MTEPAPEINQPLDCDFYTVADLAQLVGINVRLAYQLVEEEIRHFRVGRHIRVPKTEYQAWVNRRLNQQPAPATIPFTLNAPKGRGQRQKR